MYILDDDKYDVLDPSDEPSFCLHSKPVKDRSPLTILASTRFVRARFLNSLSLPSKKLRSTSDPKTPSGSWTPNELKTGSMRRNRTVTEPSVYSPTQGDIFSSVFNGRGMPKSPTVSLETSFVGNRGGSEEQLVDGRLARVGGSGLGLSSLGGHGVLEHPIREREQTSRERLGGDGGSSSGTNLGAGGGGGSQFKSRSQSFNTDTTTSGISSMSSSPSRETVGNPEHPDTEPDSSDCVSLNTVVSAKTVTTLSSLSPQINHLPPPKSSTVSLVPPGSSHTLPRRAQSLKSPSVTTIKSLVDCSFVYTSPRDALGYATLKRLQQQRIHPSLSHSDALASPAKDVLFTDTITMKTGSLDSRLTPRRYATPRHAAVGLRAAFLESRDAGVDPFDDRCCLSHYSGGWRCENVSCAPSAVSVRTRERRDTCPEPSGLNPYRRLSRTLVPRWVDLHCVLLHRDVASSSSPDECVLDASASPMSFTASSSLRTH